MSNKLLGLLMTCLAVLTANISHAADIDEINAAIQASEGKWFARETPLSHLSPEEMRKWAGALEPDHDAARHADHFSLLSLALPSSFDWASNGYVTPVRNQYGCGSCWAFATVAALEAKALITFNQPGTDLDLSEQIVLSCSGGGGCGGGYADTAANFLKNTGTDLEDCNPYTATNGNCSQACANWQNDSYKIDAWSYVATGTTADASTIKNAIYTQGPVVAWMELYDDFYSYSQGVYSYVTGNYEGNHVVLVVGWDDGLGAFHVKNSWGTSWGESGYFWISYNELYGMKGSTAFGEWVYAFGNAIAPEVEIISAPTAISGPSAGITNNAYSYSTGGSVSSLGHPVQYLFDWGDGTNSGWLAIGQTNALKSWSYAGTYNVRAQARCAIDTSVTSGWSGALSVTISAPETVSAPTTLSGPKSGTAGVSYSFTTGGSASSYGRPVQYQFDWKGDASDLSSWGSGTQSKIWAAPGTYYVRARAQSSTDTSVVSAWSGSLSVTISPAPLSYSITTNPSALQIAVDGASCTGPCTFAWVPGSTHTLSVASPQSVIPGTRYIFLSWSDGGAQAHTMTASASCTSYTASFNIQYSLTTSVNTPAAGVIIPSGPNWYDNGQTVTMTAISSSRYIFVGWSGDLSGEGNPASITMNGPVTVTANFGIGPDLTGLWTTPLAQTCRTIGKSQRCTLIGTLTVENISNRDALSTYVDFYLSENGTQYDIDHPFKQISTTKIKGGKSIANRLNYNLPIGQNAKDKYIIAVIDKDNLVKEIDETNNIVILGPIQ